MRACGHRPKRGSKNLLLEVDSLTLELAFEAGGRTNAVFALDCKVRGKLKRLILNLVLDLVVLENGWKQISNRPWKNEEN